VQLLTEYVGHVLRALMDFSKQVNAGDIQTHYAVDVRRVRPNTTKLLLAQQQLTDSAPGAPSRAWRGVSLKHSLARAPPLVSAKHALCVETNSI
jgi:hypothetical protein